MRLVQRLLEGPLAKVGWLHLCLVLLCLGSLGHTAECSHCNIECPPLTFDERHSPVACVHEIFLLLLLLLLLLLPLLLLLLLLLLVVPIVYRYGKVAKVLV